jgi:hypothetical protein
VVRSSDRAKLMPLVCRSFGQFSVNGGINEVTMNAKTSCRCTKASSAVATHDLGRRTAGDTDRRCEPLIVARVCRKSAAKKSFLSYGTLKKYSILATPALFRPHELKTCLEAGCNGYIVKPFSFLDLEIKIRELLGTSSEQLALTN